MIKNDELRRLRAQAERSGESNDVWAYVEKIEERLASPHSAFLHDPGDAERTEQTDAAHREAEKVVDGSALVSGPVQVVVMNDVTYVLEVRGQASATAHGYQGFRPARGELLQAVRSAGLPVFLAFRDGGTWETQWLESLPPAKPLRIAAGDREGERYGWYAGEKPERGEPLFDRKDYLSIPLVHDPKPPAQAGLV
jgi:hypothetical protein